MSDPQKVERFWELLTSRQDDDSGLWTMTTLGMDKSITGQEFILRNIPPLLLAGAVDMLNRLCAHVVRKQAVILEGEVYQGDRVTMVRFATAEFAGHEMLELLPVTEFYESLHCSNCKETAG